MPHYNVLFLCTGNSARSIMAEAIMRRKSGAYFTVYSAGSHPAGFVRPEAISQIEKVGFSTADLRSKSWDEFSKPGSPTLNFVFTVCDNAAKETTRQTLSRRPSSRHSSDWRYRDRKASWSADAWTLGH